jgi:hypothetical protein
MHQVKAGGSFSQHAWYAIACITFLLMSGFLLFAFVPLLEGVQGEEGRLVQDERIIKTTATKKHAHSVTLLDDGEEVALCVEQAEHDAPLLDDRERGRERRGDFIGTEGTGPGRNMSVGDMDSDQLPEPMAVPPSEMLRTTRFLHFFLLLFSLQGGGLMLLNNITQMVKAQDGAADLGALLVSLLSICNCFGRLGAGGWLVSSVCVHVCARARAWCGCVSTICHGHYFPHLQFALGSCPVLTNHDQASAATCSQAASIAHGC